MMLKRSKKITPKDEDKINERVGVLLNERLHKERESFKKEQGGFTDQIKSLEHEINQWKNATGMYYLDAIKLKRIIAGVHMLLEREDPAMGLARAAEAFEQHALSIRELASAVKDNQERLLAKITAKETAT